MTLQNNKSRQHAAIDTVLKDAVKHMDDAVQSSGLPNGRVWAGADLYEYLRRTGGIEETEFVEKGSGAIEMWWPARDGHVVELDPLLNPTEYSLKPPNV